jgi:hypothetical protein
VESRTCRSPEPRAGDGANFEGRLIRESVGRPSSGVTREDIHEPMEKQSQSCCPKKSGFWVWTSGRFVNMLDEKDILVCIHTRNIPRAWGCFWHVKVPSSPYKRGREGTCKRTQTFWNLCNLQRESQSLGALTLCLNVLRTLSRVRGIIQIFRVSPNIVQYLFVLGQSGTQAFLDRCAFGWWASCSPWFYEIRVLACLFAKENATQASHVSRDAKNN